MAETALLWGLASAASLPLGALLGLVWRPGSRVASVLMAFGAGALLFALSVELMASVPEHVATHGGTVLVAALAGAVAGGLLFDVLNQLLNNRGAFLRNLSNTRSYVARTKKQRAKRVARRLARVASLRALAPEEIAELVKRVRRERFREGEVIFGSGDAARELHFVYRGEVEIVRETERGGYERVALIGEDEAFGEQAVIRGGERRTTARAVGRASLYTLEKDELDAAIAEVPALAAAIDELARSRLRMREETGPDRWEEAVEDALDETAVTVSEDEMREESREAVASRGAALAIWLGIAIDAIPESLVIGTLATSREGVSLAFVAGVFLANFPEAFSSAAVMRHHGTRRRRILLMWSSLCLLTGIGAWSGAVLFPPEPEGRLFYLTLAIEAMAAGAMLTMIAQTMLPEAFEQGGSIVGFATLSGFLVALAVAAL